MTHRAKRFDEGNSIFSALGFALSPLRFGTHYQKSPETAVTRTYLKIRILVQDRGGAEL